MSVKEVNRTIWLIGATSGIGYAVAMKMAERGNRVIISGRSQQILQEMEQKFPENFHALPFDASDQDAVKKAAEKLKSTFGSIDTLFFNAGTARYVDTKDFKAKEFEVTYKVNFFSLIYCLEEALPLLRKGTRPYILGMGSSSSFLGLPRAQAYGSSKAAIHYLMDSLRVDLTQEGIDVSTILPGFVKTPLTDKNDFDMPFIIDADKAADLILRGMDKRNYNIHFPKTFTLMLKFLGSFVPGKIRNSLLQKTVRKS